jgi:hypothetical protein
VSTRAVNVPPEPGAALGMRTDPGFDGIVRACIADDMPNTNA